MFAGKDVVTQGLGEEVAAPHGDPPLSHDHNIHKNHIQIYFWLINVTFLRNKECLSRCRICSTKEVSLWQHHPPRGFRRSVSQLKTTLSRVSSAGTSKSLQSKQQWCQKNNNSWLILVEQKQQIWHRLFFGNNNKLCFFSFPFMVVHIASFLFSSFILVVWALKEDFPLHLTFDFSQELGQIHLKPCFPGIISSIPLCKGREKQNFTKNLC